MDEKLIIKRIPEQDYILLDVTGRIDGYWSKLLDENLESALKDGDHNIALDFEKVDYLSSLGIRVLIKYAKLLKSVNGTFGIVKVSENVKSVLEMVGLDSVLKWEKPEVNKDEHGNGYLNEIEADGFSFKMAPNNSEKDAFLKCKFIGNPEKIGTKSFGEEDCKSIKFGKGRHGIGMGALGSGFSDCNGRFGEFISVGDNLAYMPAGKNNTPDFMVSSGKLIPEIEMLYGIVLEGEFSRFIRFAPVAGSAQAVSAVPAKTPQAKSVSIGKIVRNIYELYNYESFAFVMIAEISGIVGASVINSKSGSSGNNNLFEYPQVKENINFTTEPEFGGNVALCLGVATKKQSPEIAKYFRPLSVGSNINSHIHSAVFSYSPVGRSETGLDEMVGRLFEEDKILSVLHLINDERESLGTGESEFLHGVCWVGSIKDL